MGLLGNFRRTLERTRVARDSTKLLTDGHPSVAFKTVKAFVNSDQRLQEVIGYFDAREDEVRHIFWSMLEFTNSEIARGHAICISTLLETDTLAYMLRARRGQVDADSAHALVQQYFHTSAPYFAPEREYRKRNGL